MSGSSGLLPTLIIATALVVFVVCVLGALMFMMRSRMQWMNRAQGLGAQEWVRKMDELGIGVQTPALHEIVVGVSKPWGDDFARVNEKVWSKFMPLSATRNINVGTPSHPMLQVVILLRMPTSKPPKSPTHRRQATETTLLDPCPELDVGLAVYSRRCRIS